MSLHMGHDNSELPVTQPVGGISNQMSRNTAVGPKWRERAAVTVEGAGEILGIGRSAAYSAAKAGQIPTIRVGRRLIVPTARLRAMLGETPETNEGATAANGDTLVKLAAGDGPREVYER
jgi:hypothetical protein